MQGKQQSPASGCGGVRAVMEHLCIGASAAEATEDEEVLELTALPSPPPCPQQQPPSCDGRRHSDSQGGGTKDLKHQQQQQQEEEEEEEEGAPQPLSPAQETPLLSLLRRLLSRQPSERPLKQPPSPTSSQPCSDGKQGVWEEWGAGSDEEVADLARVLLEGMPDVWGSGSEGEGEGRELASLSSTLRRPALSRVASCRTPHTLSTRASPVTTPAKRLAAAEVVSLATEAAVGVTGVEWGRLVGVIESELLGEEEHSGGLLVEVNSGGKVFFALLGQQGRREGAVCVKFGADKLGTQGELLAYELAAHLGVPCPPCRLLRRGQPEWKALQAATVALDEQGGQSSASELSAWLKANRCALVIGYVPGCALHNSHSAFADLAAAEATAEALGRVLLLDLVLCNADRLPVESMAWRGNPANLRYGPYGVAAIDHTLPRRPPAGVACCPTSCQEMAHTIATGGARGILEHAVAHCAGAKEAMAEGHSESLVAAFVRGFTAAVHRCQQLEEGLELLHECLEDCVGEFFVAVGLGASKAELSPNTAMLRQVQRQAKLDGSFWESFREAEVGLKVKLAETRSAVEEWRANAEVEEPLLTGFLDSEVTPLVQAYELKVRLDHILARCTAMTGTIPVATREDGLPSTAPVIVAPGLFIGGVLVAGSRKDLKAAGITHIVNAAGSQVEDYFPADFSYLRIELDDTPEASAALAATFEASNEFIDSAVRSGGGVLVHCFEGRSRSATLLLAYLMARKGRTLREAMAELRTSHPPTRPNPGFLTRLRDLDLSLHGRASTRPVRRSSQPAAKTCPVCTKQVGISMSSLTAHMRRHHPNAWEQREAADK